MSDLSDSMLGRVRKLLAKAEDPSCTPEEAAALNDKAAELIAKYGVDRALLASTGEVQDEVGDRVMVLPDPYARDKARLLVRVAAPLRVRVIFNTGASRHIRGFRVHLFGFTADLDRVEILFTSLLVQASFGMASARPAGDWWRDPTPSQVAAFRRDWLTGFGAKVHQRLSASEDRAKQEAAREGSSGMELVFVGRNAAVDTAIQTAYPKLTGEDKGRRVRSNDAYRDGAVAGAKADLGSGRLGTGSRNAIDK